MPIAATSRSLLASTGTRPALMVAECWSEQPAGRWAYVMTMRCSPGDEPSSGEVRLAELGESAPTGDVVVWDWRARVARRTARDARWNVTLAPEEWTFDVIAPVLECGIAVIGDTSKFVTAGDARIVVRERSGGIQLTLLGANERMTITGWAAVAPTRNDGEVSHDAGTGVWTTDVDVPARGWCTVLLTPG